MNSLQDKIILITGALSGIGMACAEQAIQSHAKMVILTDYKKEGKLNLTDRMDYHHLDVRSEENWKEVVSYIESKYGDLDILINNASITGAALEDKATNLESTSLESWRKVQNTNLEGMFLGCKYVLPLLKKSPKAAIINVSSRSGAVGRKDRLAYSTSKSAMVSFTKSIAIDMADQGLNIRCNAVIPSTILTKLWDPVVHSPANKDNALIESIADKIPMKRFGKPEEVAKAILFLASDDASYITGTTLCIDGGASALDSLRV